MLFEEYKFEPKIFRGENAIKNFLRELLKTKDEILNIINKNTPMIISESEQKEYKILIYVIYVRKKLI